MKICGSIDGIPVQCSGDNLEEAPVETTAVSNGVVFENKFIDIFAGIEPGIRMVNYIILQTITIIITSFTSTNVKLRLRFQVHLTFH